MAIGRGISHGVKTVLVVIHGTPTAVRYTDQIIQRNVLSFLRKHNRTLRQDNARPRVTRDCRDVLAANRNGHHRVTIYPAEDMFEVN